MTVSTDVDRRCIECEETKLISLIRCVYYRFGNKQSPNFRSQQILKNKKKFVITAVLLFAVATVTTFYLASGTPR